MQREFRVVVAGSRDFTNYTLLCNSLTRILSKKREEGYKIIILSGRARGADKLGEKYAREQNISIETYPADWEKHGKKAGYIRNKEMIEVANACVVYWDGQSRGSAHTIRLAEEKGVPLRVIKYECS